MNTPCCGQTPGRIDSRCGQTPGRIDNRTKFHSRCGQTPGRIDNVIRALLNICSDFMGMAIHEHAMFTNRHQSEYYDDHSEWSAAYRKICAQDTARNNRLCCYYNSLSFYYSQGRRACASSLGTPPGPLRGPQSLEVLIRAKPISPAMSYYVPPHIVVRSAHGGI